MMGFLEDTIAQSNQKRHNQAVRMVMRKNHMLKGENLMKYLLLVTLIILVTLSVSGCGIPDLPGPIGIPGV